MATKKSKGSKKKAPKKRAAKKKGGKKRKKATRRQDGKGTIVFFMGKLIEAGYLGKSIPKESKPQNRAAMAIRQMAEKLARQTRKYGDEDVGLGEED